MFTRLSQLLAAPTQQLHQEQQPADAAGPQAQAPPRERGQGALLSEIRRSWDVFLHLTPPQHLAALVRASCETGLLLQPAPSARVGAGAAAGGGAAAGAAAVLGGDGGSERGLVRRSLDVLLDGGGRELSEAGPQAVLDLSYGLMLAGCDDAATWRTLGPLLRAAAAQLKGGGGGASGADGGSGAELAARVLKWVEQKGL